MSSDSIREKAESEAARRYGEGFVVGLHLSLQDVLRKAFCQGAEWQAEQDPVSDIERMSAAVAAVTPCACSGQRARAEAAERWVNAFKDDVEWLRVAPAGDRADRVMAEQELEISRLKHEIGTIRVHERQASRDLGVALVDTEERLDAAEAKLATVRAVMHPGNWSALDARRAKILEIIDGEGTSDE